MAEEREHCCDELKRVCAEAVTLLREVEFGDTGLWLKKKIDTFLQEQDTIDAEGAAG